MTLLYDRFPPLRLMFDVAFYFYRHLPNSPHKVAWTAKRRVRKAESLAVCMGAAERAAEWTETAALPAAPPPAAPASPGPPSSDEEPPDPPPPRPELLRLGMSSCPAAHPPAFSARSCVLLDRNLPLAKMIMPGTLLLNERSVFAQGSERSGSNVDTLRFYYSFFFRFFVLFSRTVL